MFPFDDVIMPCTHASRTNKLHLICYSYVFSNGYRAVMAKFKDPLDTSGLIDHSMIVVCNRDVSPFAVIFTYYLPCNDIKILTRKFLFHSCSFFFNKGTTPHYFLSGCLLGMFIIYSYHTFPQLQHICKTGSVIPIYRKDDLIPKWIGTISCDLLLFSCDIYQYRKIGLVSISAGPSIIDLRHPLRKWC